MDNLTIAVMEIFKRNTESWLHVHIFSERECY